MSDEMMELKPQDQEQDQPQDQTEDQPQDQIHDQNQDLQQRNDFFIMETASELLAVMNDKFVKEESEYSPEAIAEWEEHKKEASQEGGSDHE